MKTSDFKFKLPKELIAKYPNINRSGCRLLLLNKLTGEINHHFFTDIVEKLFPGDLLVFNDTRVIPARLYGYSSVTGKKVEILVERILDNGKSLAYIRSSEHIQLGTKFILGIASSISIYVVSLYSKNYYNLYEIYFDNTKDSVLTILNNFGHIPVPPYFKRLSEKIDYEFYQTVYGTQLGSVAASTAGLHFDYELIDKLLKLGVEIAFITLHIGSASFFPVRSCMIKNHVMHSEYIDVSQKTVEAIVRCKARKNRVIAVGTTVVKSLETAAIYSKSNTIINTFSGYAQTFIVPGYCFKIVDALITNFHLSESTLIMLVAAFAGYYNTFYAYHVAVKSYYKFLSYGDAMLII